MDKVNLIIEMSKNQSKREAYLEIMEDLRINGHVELHLKYMEKYDKLTCEYQWMETQLKAASAA